ncbi:hypothetical protein EDD86DRAFT_65129 [Gorgonomyces haynaldii]|nr:hypothetical protein EDD86DRAFT_65129 [Gorgonomyces haynaldii]
MLKDNKFLGLALLFMTLILFSLQFMTSGNVYWRQFKSEWSFDEDHQYWIYENPLGGLKKEAVCIVGNKAITMLMPKILYHHREGLFSDETDLYLYLQTDMPPYSSHSSDDLHQDSQKFFNLTQLQEMYGPWLKKAVIFQNDTLDRMQVEYDETHRDPNPTGKGYGQRMFFGWKRCHQLLIEPQEIRRGVRYDVVVKTRPDIMLLQKPKIRELAQEDPEKLYIAGGNCTMHPDGTFRMHVPMDVPNDKIFFGSSKIMELGLRTYDILSASIAQYPHEDSYPEAMFAYAMLRVKTQFKCGGLAHIILRGQHYEQELGWGDDSGFNDGDSYIYWGLANVMDGFTDQYDFLHLRPKNAPSVPSEVQSLPPSEPEAPSVPAVEPDVKEQASEIPAEPNAIEQPSETPEEQIEVHPSVEEIIHPPSDELSDNEIKMD